MPKPLPRLADPSPVGCPPLGTGTARLTDVDAVGLAVRLKALADPARLQLLDHLVREPGRAARTRDLAPVINLSEPTTSHHLAQLLSAGLLTKSRDGMNVPYQMTPHALQAIARVLDC